MWPPQRPPYLTGPTEDPAGTDHAIDPTTNRIDKTNNPTTEHDASGNMTKDDLKRYTFDAEGRIVEVKSLAGTVEATYYYNGSAQRVKKVIAGGDTTRYISQERK